MEGSQGFDNAVAFVIHKKLEKRGRRREVRTMNN
jgi:hypothetical protein